MSAEVPSGSRGGVAPRVSATKVVIVTTVMLTFISFWRAAAVVMNDMSSTAYYIGGIAEEAIGKAGPWFILMVMLFSYAVRSVYIESCSMFVRGGVYRVVKEAMGSTMAKLSVSALIFDYVLTGPISVVSAGQYMHGLLNNGFLHVVGHPLPIGSDLFATLFAIAATIYFWWLNIKGIEESSGKALRIMQVTTVMVVLLVGWTLYTMYVRWHTGADGGLHLPPLRPVLTEHSLGWLSGIPWMKTIGLAVFMVAFGHSILAMSGEETLAQVYREIEAPKHRNLMRAALAIFLYSLVFTTFVSFAAVMLIPDQPRLHTYNDNLINGLVTYMSGPAGIKLLMQAFVVIVGALILSGAANTAIIGANGVLNRVAEDGVLDDWFREPQKRYGTTHRIINLIVGLQLLTILISRGNVYVLGEAYAFGVVWSFAFKALSMLMLRWKYKGERTWKVPLNFHVRGVEIPVGLALITSVLVAVAVVNLFTKSVATVSGVVFTAVFFVLFALSEWHNHHKRLKAAVSHEHREKFVLDRRSDVGPEALNLPACTHRVLVPIKNPNNLTHLTAALEQSHDTGTEIVVLTIKIEKGDQGFEHVFTGEEEKLFTKVVEVAEKYGETVTPLVVPSNNSWFAIARTAREIEAHEILLGQSGTVPADIQLEQLAIMWAMVNPIERPITVRVVVAGGQEVTAVL